MDGNHIMVRDLPQDERPRERMLQFGANSLSNTDLLAIILRTGSKAESVIHLSQRILSELETLHNLVDVSIEELTNIKGVGIAKAIQIKAAIELGKRMVRHAPQDKYTIRSPKDVANYLMEEMRYLKQEHFVAIFLNTKNHVIGKETISVGSLNASIVHPREVFKPAIKKSASSMIVVHNHPSGDPSPSREDIEVTNRLKKAGEVLGIDVLDHVIIGDNHFLSIKEKGLIG